MFLWETSPSSLNLNAPLSPPKPLVSQFMTVVNMSAVPFKQVGIWSYSTVKKRKKLCLTVSSAAPSMQQFWFWNHYVLKHISPKFKIGFSSSPFSYTSVTQTDLTQSLSTSLKIKSLSSIIFAHTVYFRGNWYLQNTHTPRRPGKHSVSSFKSP